MFFLFSFYVGISGKREHSESGEGSTSKRQRVSGNLNSLDCLSETQVQELLDRVVETTDEWPSQQLEILYSSLELTLEKNHNNDDLFTTIIDCIENFHKYKQFRGTIFRNDE